MNRRRAVATMATTAGLGFFPWLLQAIDAKRNRKEKGGRKNRRRDRPGPRGRQPSGGDR